MKIAAFPKCWITELSEGTMDLYDWIDESVALGTDGLEMYDRFLRTRESSYLHDVRRAV